MRVKAVRKDLMGYDLIVDVTPVEHNAKKRQKIKECKPSENTSTC